MKSNALNHQRGMALLTVLLLVVAITIVAGSMLARQRLLLREYALMQDQTQFREAALMGEGVAHQILQQDSQVNATDSLQDSWAKPIDTLTIDSFRVQVQINDAANRFNINNLYHDGKPDPLALAYMQALLLHIGLEPNIANAVLDWQDPDNQPMPDGGAEADFYQSLGVAHPAPITNQPFTCIDDLRFVRGLDAQKVAVLKPYITAQPFYLPMNVNTAEPVLLQIAPIAAALTIATADANQSPTQATNQSTMDENQQPDADNNAPTPNKHGVDPAALALDQQAVNEWARLRRSNPPLESVSQLWALPMFSQNQDLSRLAALFDVQSRAFEVTITVDKEGKQRVLQSTLAKVDADDTTSATSDVNLVQNKPKIIVAFNRRFLPNLGMSTTN